MANKNVMVGYQNKDTFESVKALVLGGCFGKDKYKVEKDCIVYGDMVFELSKKQTSGSESEQIGFNKKGATWFKPLRGEVFESDDAKWKNFVEVIKEEYHLSFSVVEYKEQPKTDAEKSMAFTTANNIAKKFIDVFYPSMSGKTYLRESRNSVQVSDVWGVAMRNELSAGTGESVPVLGKVYFNKVGGEVIPITSDIASRIENGLKGVLGEGSKEFVEGNLKDTPVEEALNAMDNLIKENGENFFDYFCLSSEVDENLIKSMCQTLSFDSEKLSLECSKVDVLYISHVKTNEFVYEIVNQRNNLPLFKLVLGSNDTIKVSCLTCGDEELLVDTNKIMLNINGATKSVELNVNAVNFGLTSEDIEKVGYFSNLLNHLKTVKCAINSKNFECERFKCKNQLFGIEENGETIYKCKDCQHPEIVYVDNVLDKQYYTPHVVFAKDKMSLANKEETGTCTLCGRRFTNESLTNRGFNTHLCPTCQAIDADINDSHKKLYKKYRTMLPLSTRLFALFSKKGCIEDQEIILFKVGNKTYIFNKLNAKEKGFMPKPRKI